MKTLLHLTDSCTLFFYRFAFLSFLTKDKETCRKPDIFNVLASVFMYTRTNIHSGNNQHLFIIIFPTFFFVFLFWLNSNVRKVPIVHSFKKNKKRKSKLFTPEQKLYTSSVFKHEPSTLVTITETINSSLHSNKTCLMLLFTSSPNSLCHVDVTTSIYMAKVPRKQKADNLTSYTVQNAKE